jgi:hypothetical protein
VFEDTETRWLVFEWAGRSKSKAVDHDQLAGFDVADVLSANELKRGTLAGDDPAFTKLAQTERAKSVGVADRDHLVDAEEHQRVGAFDSA